MMVRDQLNSFDNYLDIENRNREYVQKDLMVIAEREADERAGVQSYPRDNMSIVSDLYQQLAECQFNIISCEYSKGNGLDASFLDDYLIAVSYMQRGWQAQYGYIQMVWMLSIGIMLEVDDVEFNKLALLVKQQQLQDSLVDFLIRSRNPGWEQRTQDFLMPRPYSNIREVVTLAALDKLAAVQRLERYLTQQWYADHQETGWYNAHESKENVHVGYWSFESGALVKILELDDLILKDVPYYPYDMVRGLQ
ncbi:hypothetical protein CUZ56_01805 [Saezia sanguinis]|uniref:PoNi C-terminal domain-containing protein n=1 Tax=Saezia sanguinis TaxID=1965230 RepID=A0A433SCQ6_9BURK|nr:PoNi-like cognate immunity protein [Saezia sanguinis]RUS66525.1 hypothetical protein CUZ56_01805 [Saezia sanguinis]